MLVLSAPRKNSVDRIISANVTAFGCCCCSFGWCESVLCAVLYCTLSCQVKWEFPQYCGHMTLKHSTSWLNYSVTPSWIKFYSLSHQRSWKWLSFVIEFIKIDLVLMNVCGFCILLMLCRILFFIYLSCFFFLRVLLSRGGY